MMGYVFYCLPNSILTVEARRFFIFVYSLMRINPCPCLVFAKCFAEDNVV